MRINILWVINNLNTGGAQKLLIDFLNSYDKSLYNVSVAVFNKGHLYESVMKLGVPIYVCPRRNKYDISIIWKLRKIIKTQSIDILVGDLFASRTWSRIAAWFEHTPCIVLKHTDPPRVKKFLYRIIEKILAPHTSKYIVCNDYLQKIVADDFGVSPEKIVTIYPSIDRENLKAHIICDEIYKVFNLSKNNFIVSVIGRLEYQKGFDFLLENIDKSLFDNGLRIIIKGTGTQKEELYDIIKTRQVDKYVHFSGEIFSVGDILSITNLFLIPSRYEGFPLTMIEAASLGIPIMGSNIDGIKEFRNYYDGIELFSIKNPDDINNKLSQYIKSPKKYFTPLPNFDIQTRTEKLQQIFKEVHNEFYYL